MVINMRLAPVPASRAAGRTTAVRTRRPPAAPKATPRTVIPPKPEPETKVKGRVDPVRTAEKSVFGKAPEPATTKTGGRTTAPSTKPAAEEPAEEGGEFAMPGVGSAGVTGLEGGNFPYTMYVDRMTTKIGSSWFRPQVTGELITVVYFVIERNGTLRDVRVERSSGNRTFDRAAYRAVLESSPLPPLPMQYSGTHLGVHLTFH
jgi:TonB family protein